MSVEPDPGREPLSARALIARAGRAGVRADRRLTIVAADLGTDAEDRLDDRARAAFGSLLASLIGTVRDEIARHAARVLRDGGEAPLADALLADEADDRRLAACLLDDAATLRELDGRVRLDLLAEALVPRARADADRPSLLPRLAGDRDPAIAGPAMAMLLAGSRRAAPPGSGPPARTDLSAEAHHRFVWHVAADLRRRCAALSDARAASLDRALVAAAERSLAAHDEGIRLEAAALKLAAALADADRGGPAAAREAIGDRLPALFVALVAEGLGIDDDDVRDAVLDPDAARLALMLRALGMDRDAIAEIGLALATADPRRSLDALADTLDAVADVDPDAARAAFADDLLPGAYRAARAALGRAAP